MLSRFLGILKIARCESYIDILIGFSIGLDLVKSDLIKWKSCDLKIEYLPRDNNNLLMSGDKL